MSALVNVNKSMRVHLVKRGVPVGLLAILLIGMIAGRLFQGSSPEPEHGMAYIPGGTYRPLFTSPADTALERVAPFQLDAYPVTNAEYLEFVKANPTWRRSKIKRLFADEGYLGHWSGDLDFGADSLADSPVVNVSWFAASAYAEWKGKRLPTVAEWELVASAGEKGPDKRKEPAFEQQILAWLSEAGSGNLAPVGQKQKNYWGVYDMHGLVWEWVMDFNTALVTGDSRNNTNLDQKLFCGSGAVGASDFEDYPAFLRFGFRSGLNANYTVPNLGFRCASDVKPDEKTV